MKNQSKCIVKVELVSLSRIMKILLQMRPNAQPVTIDIDLHLLIMSKCRSETSCNAKANKAMSLMKIFSFYGRVVFSITDPAHLYQSKITSIQRRTEKIFKSAGITSTRYEQTQVYQKLNIGSYDDNEKESFLK